MDIAIQIEAMARAAKAASALVANAPVDQRNAALLAIREAIAEDRDAILIANERDLEQGRISGLDEALIDRLALNPARLDAVEEGLIQVAALADPIGAGVGSQDNALGYRGGHHAGAARRDWHYL